MSAEQVNYAKVVDALAIAIGELNRPCAVEPTAPVQAAVNRRAETQRDAAILLRGLLGELEHGGADGADGTAAAAAVHAATNQGILNVFKKTVEAVGKTIVTTATDTGQKVAGIATKTAGAAEVSGMEIAAAAGTAADLTKKAVSDAARVGEGSAKEMAGPAKESAAKARDAAGATKDGAKDGAQDMLKAGNALAGGAHTAGEDIIGDAKGGAQGALKGAKALAGRAAKETRAAAGAVARAVGGAGNDAA